MTIIIKQNDSSDTVQNGWARDLCEENSSSRAGRGPWGSVQKGFSVEKRELLSECSPDRPARLSCSARVLCLMFDKTWQFHCESSLPKKQSAWKRILLLSNQAIKRKHLSNRPRVYKIMLVDWRKSWFPQIFKARLDFGWKVQRGQPSSSTHTPPLSHHLQTQHSRLRAQV